MKRFFLYIGIITTSVAFTSCKQDYVCVCTDAAGNQNAYQLQGLIEDDAETACNNYEVATRNDCSLQEL